MKTPGEQFIHQKDPKLHISKSVEQEVKRRRLAKETVSQKPAEKIADWLEIIKKTHTGHRENPEVAERIKEYYRKEYVIKPEEIPESYFENQKRLAREQGHGDIEITGELKRQSIEVIVSDQKSTLDNWINYFTSPDSDSYPMWVKYWAFTSMLKLSSFDKEKHAFAKRDKNTVAPFPDLNREALAYVVDAIVKKANNEKIKVADNNPELKQLLEGASFGKLYAWAIEKVTPTEKSELENTKGEWKKYVKGSDHMPLVNSLQGYGTNWCTAGELTARNQLKGGDFYVYYSYDENGKPEIPRVAIRMQENQIAEVRGIAKEQNLDPYIVGIVDEKLKEFPDGEKYKKKTADMKKLTEIENRTRKGGELAKEDLRFLYEIDFKIDGFGYQDDPRIRELLAGRDVKSDISLITGYVREQISVTHKEALAGGIKYHYGYLNLSNLTSAEGLKLPKNIGGSLDLFHLTSAEGLKLPKNIGGSLDLFHLTSAEGLKLPENIGGSLDLFHLTSAEGLKLPENIGGSLHLSSLISAEGLKLPENIGGSLYLSGLTSAEGLKLPKNIGGSLNLSSLTSAEGLNLSENIGGSLDLSDLTSAKDLKLPENIGGSLNLSSLISAEGLKLPESIGSYLDLSRLTSAKGLKLPESIGGCLNLSNLTSAEGLKLPESIGSYLDLSSLTFADIEKLREKYPQLKILGK